jgi:hypothetical protein
MAEPIREQILAAMADRLGTIAWESNARTVPALVTRALLSIDQYKAELEAGPVLGVMRSSGSTFEPMTLTSRRHQVVVAVWGYVRGDATVGAGTWLERLWDDTVRVLLADPKLGGLAVDVELSGPTDTDDGALEPEAAFAQNWLVTVHEHQD